MAGRLLFRLIGETFVAAGQWHAKVLRDTAANPPQRKCLVKLFRRFYGPNAHVLAGNENLVAFREICKSLAGNDLGSKSDHKAAGVN